MRPFFLFLLIPLIFTSLLSAWEDPFQADLNLNYERLWMKPGPCHEEPLIQALPDLQREGLDCPAEKTPQNLPPVSASLNLEAQNLIHKNGRFGFADENAASDANVRLSFIPKLDIRSSLQRVQWDRSLGDTLLRVKEQQTLWQLQNSLAYELGSYWTSYLVANWNNTGGWEYALALRGRTPSGFSGSVALGVQREAYPITLTLQDYTPISMPFLLQQKFAAFSLGWEHQLVSVALTSRWHQSAPVASPGGAYSLSDSGQNLENIVNLALADSEAAGRFRISMEAEWNSGQHIFQATHAAETPFVFGYEETREQDFSMRVDAQAGIKAWETGIFTGASGLDWNALRPAEAYDKYFWDRNGVLDSYEGNLFSLFEDETWLFDGNANFRQWSTGAWLARNFSHWRAQCGLAYNVLDMAGVGHLSKKTTTLLIAYTEQDYSYDFDGLRAELLTPEIQISGRWGRFFVEASLAQALPLSAHFEGVNDSSSSRLSASSYSGGTKASAKMGWGFF